MDGYKKIIKSRRLRETILVLLRFVPDKYMVKLQYRIKTGRGLDLKNLQRYSEKMQWYKLYYRNPNMVRCTDKFDVRDYLSSKGYGNLLNECYGVYNSFEEIEFDKFPNQFVIKDTLGSGGVSVIVVKDKHLMDKSQIKKQVDLWVSEKKSKLDDGREWAYHAGKKHRIIVEKYIDSIASGGLTDYKFFCFAGKIACVYVINNRVLGQHGQLAIMNKNFERLSVQSKTQEVMTGNPEKPINYDEMTRIASELSKEFPHVRVDLYNENGKILFGELTFYGASGYIQYDPDEFDYKLGEYFKVPK